MANLRKSDLTKDYYLASSPDTPVNKIDYLRQGEPLSKALVTSIQIKPVSTVDYELDPKVIWHPSLLDYSHQRGDNTFRWQDSQGTHLLNVTCKADLKQIPRQIRLNRANELVWILDMLNHCQRCGKLINQNSFAKGGSGICGACAEAIRENRWSSIKPLFNRINLTVSN